MSDEELARWIHRIDHYIDEEKEMLIVNFEGEELHDNQIRILEWLQSQINPEF